MGGAGSTAGGRRASHTTERADDPRRAHDRGGDEQREREPVVRRGEHGASSRAAPVPWTVRVILGGHEERRAERARSAQPEATQKGAGYDEPSHGRRDRGRVVGFGGGQQSGVARGRGRAPLDCTQLAVRRGRRAGAESCRPSSTGTTTSARACATPRSQTSPHHQCGQKGAAVDLAWGVTQGDPDVRIAVLDSGIKWRDADAMRDLADKAYLNRGEVTPPCARRAATATATAGSRSPTSARSPTSTATASPIPRTSS